MATQSLTCSGDYNNFPFLRKSSRTGIDSWILVSIDRLCVLTKRDKEIVWKRCEIHGAEVSSFVWVSKMLMGIVAGFLATTWQLYILLGEQNCHYTSYLESTFCLKHRAVPLYKSHALSLAE